MTETEKLLGAASKAAAIINSPSEEAVKDLAVTAAEAVLSSPDLQAALSTESTGFLSGLSAAATSVMSLDVGKLAQVAKLSPKAFAAQIAMQAVGTVLSLAASQAASLAAGTAAGSVAAASAAYAGAIAAAYAAMVAMAAPLNAELAKQAEARAQHVLGIEKHLFGSTRDQFLLRPPPTGARGENRPADLFHWTNFASAGYKVNAAGCDHSLHRSLLGYALIKLTESGLETFPQRPNSDIGEEPEKDMERPKCGIPVFQPISRTYYPTYLAAVRAKQGNQQLGIPEDRRKTFRMLRRAIEAQYGVPGTDGGASLWPAYMDLLVREFDEGHVTPEAVSDFLWFGISWDIDTPKKKYAKRERELSPLAPAAINQMVDAWRKTVNPIYAQDVAAREAANKTFVALSKVAALKRVGQTKLPAPLLADIPPEIQKQLGVSPLPAYVQVEDQKRRVAELKAQGLSTAEIARKLFQEDPQAAKAAQAARLQGHGGGAGGAVVAIAVGLGLMAILRRRTR